MPYSLLLTTLLLAPDPVQAAIDRHAKFTASIQSAVITQSTTVNGVTPLQAKLTLKRPNLLRWDASVIGITYTWINGASDSIEYSTRSQNYRSFGKIPIWPNPPAQLEEVTNYFPTGIIATSLKRLLPPNGKFKLDGPVHPIQGTPIVAIYELDGLRFRHRFLIDPKGRISEIRYAVTGGLASVNVVSKFSNWKVNQGTSELFLPRPPMGFVSDKLPYGSTPLSREEKFPVNGWNFNGQNRSLKEVVGSKHALIAVVQQNCPMSAKLLRALSAQESAISKMGAKPLVLWSGSPGPTKFPVLGDPGGKHVSQLRLAGTPYLYLVRGDGTVDGIWQGFDAAKFGTWVKEVESAIRESK